MLLMTAATIVVSILLVFVCSLCPSSFAFAFAFVFCWLQFLPRDPFCIDGSRVLVKEQIKLFLQTDDLFENNCSPHTPCAQSGYGHLHPTYFPAFSAFFAIQKANGDTDSLPTNHPLWLLFTSPTSRDRLPLGPSPSHSLSPRIRRQRPCALVSLGLPRVRFHDFWTRSGSREFYRHAGCAFTSIFDGGMASTGRKTVRHSCMV